MNIRFSPLLSTGTRTMVPTLALFSLFLLIIGHDVPGGGFAGGLIASLALLLIFLSFGSRGLRRALPVEPDMIMGIGLAMAVAAGIIGAIFEGTFLTYTFASWDAALVGEVKVSSLLLFDLGVYVLVIGLVATATLRLGTEQP
jgi:multisubunit Na+/H+ antiporter MnhB subunit